MFFKISDCSLLPIAKKDILERDVQRLIEANLKFLFELEFVESEFSIENVRFDTLAFDMEANAPVIIEFKKSFEKSLFDQGLEYLNILFSRKADFAISLHKKLNIKPDPDAISWENSRVIFVCEQFSERQKRAISFQGLPVELWRFNWLENDFFQIEKESLDRSAKLSEFSKVLNGGNAVIQKVRSEIKDYGRDYHRKMTSEKTWELYEKIENELLSWSDFEIRYRKHFIGFHGKRSFCAIKLLKSKLKVEFGKKKDVNLFKSIKGVKDISALVWNHALTFDVENEADLTDLFFVLKKSFENS